MVDPDCDEVVDPDCDEVVDPDCDEVVDLAKLTSLDEEHILGTLRERYNKQKIYTYIGDILISINPYKLLPVYKNDDSDRYREQPRTCLPPHIFAIANSAYCGAVGEGSSSSESQCVVISGESGAGKTESTKLVVRHIMETCKGHSQLEQQILQVHPLLEAFGNARTIKNDNSSRFGKFLQLRFLGRSVVGAKINEYLLEKSRLVHQDSGEGNFHVFHYMFAGMQPEEKESYGLTEPQFYRYLCSGELPEGQKETLSETFQDLCNAMNLVGFQKQEQTDLLTILAGILSLGNVTFTEQDTSEVAITGQALKWLNTAVNQFGVGSEPLYNCLTSSCTTMRGEEIRKLYTRQQAEDARDSMAKAIYARIFSWIVLKINQLVAPKSNERLTEMREIGILDIFGFEKFEINRFEQLCINLANEQLQFFFNKHVFQLEQEAYQQEGIECDLFLYEDNKPLLDLFLGKPIGLMALMDEESRFPRGSDVTFVEKLNQNFSNNTNYEVVQGVKGDPKFAVKHYAGKVMYSARGCLEKNRDSLHADIGKILTGSEVHLLCQVFGGKISRTGTLHLPQLKGGESPVVSSKKTVGAQFRQSLIVLIEKMAASRPHFIRCLKPNEEKVPDNFQSDLVLEQLRNNGLLETTRIRRGGFSWRPSFAEFIDQYGVVLRRPSVARNKESCLEILNEVSLEGWKIGKDKLFFKYWHQDELYKFVLRLSKAVVVLQTFVRRFIVCRKFKKLLEIQMMQRQEELRILKEEEEEEKKVEEQKRLEETTVPIPKPRTKLPHARERNDMWVRPPVPAPRIHNDLFEGELHKIASDSSSKMAVCTDESNLRAVAGGPSCISQDEKFRWFAETQVHTLWYSKAFPNWFHGIISRRQTENLLNVKPPGSFLIRMSENVVGFVLSVKAATRCYNHRILHQLNECYCLDKTAQAHDSLESLILYHKAVPLEPHKQCLTDPCGQNSLIPDYMNLLQFLNARGLITSKTSPPQSNGTTTPAEPDSCSPNIAHGRRPFPRLYPSIRKAVRELTEEPLMDQTMEHTSSNNPNASKVPAISTGKSRPLSDVGSPQVPLRGSPQAPRGLLSRPKSTAVDEKSHKEHETSSGIFRKPPWKQNSPRR
uniref:myosin-IIIb-like n=1 Tax=Myxine glutinosa TaxID=7769 RepID=UPI00358F823D